jgi:hypothetical protein
MEILNEETVNKHDTSFKIMTRKGISGHERIDLYRVVAGKDHLLKGFLGSYKEGHDYLMNDYLKEYSVFQKFITELSEVVKSKICLFNFEVPEWREKTDSSMRYIKFDYEGVEVTVEICIAIKTGYNRIISAETDWLQVIHNDALDTVVERFVEEAYVIFDELFTEALVV